MSSRTRPAFRTFWPALLALALLAVVAVLASGRPAGAQGTAVITGELKQWHKITLSWSGPATSETGTPNPFLDYRLDVTFTNGGTTYVVPGYYCADGNAADTGATSGDQWCVHFAPDVTGEWTYTAVFTSGTKVALDGGGSSAGFFDGDTGSFTVAATDKTGDDFRYKGRAAVVGQHYLQHQGTGEYLLKCGADSPENAFSYVDFDATRGDTTKGEFHDWAEHAADYDAGEAAAYTWAGGKGTELLGAVNYLRGTGCNAMSFLTFSLNGDSESVAPHLDLDGGAPSFFADVYPDRFDLSKMGQWERVMQYADQEGVFLHFKTMETENDQIMNWDERRIYYRMLIAAYGHHLALNWNISEEISISQSLIADTLAYVAGVDPYGHLRVFHTYTSLGSGGQGRYTDFLGPASDLTGASLQSNINDVHRDVLNWVTQSAAAGRKWVVANDEQGGANIGVNTDDVPEARREVRDKVTWGALMGGGAGVEFYYGYQTTFGGLSCSDLTCDDHRSRASKYGDAAIALAFFRDHLPFTEMVSMDGITATTNDYVFGKDGEVYAVYLRQGQDTAITATGAEAWTRRWFNPRTGAFEGDTDTFIGGSFNIGTPPGAAGEDWVALIEATTCGGPCADPTPTPVPPPDPNAPAVLSFTLIDTDLNQPIAAYDPIPPGAKINLANLAATNISIRANTQPGTVGSVSFFLNGAFVRTENIVPYALGGDTNGDYNPWDPTPLGEFTLLATPFTLEDAGGTAGTPLSLAFELLDDPTAVRLLRLDADATRPWGGFAAWLRALLGRGGNG